VLAIAAGVYWSHRQSTAAPRAAASTSTPTAEATRPVPTPTLYLGGETGFGSQIDSDRRTFWIEFVLAAPTVTFSSVTPSVGALVGLADARVMLLPTTTARRLEASGSFDGVQSLSSLPRGENLTAIVIGRPYCAPMPDRQTVVVHVAYTTPESVGDLVIGGAPDLTASDFHSVLGPCPTASSTP
jgi:hypothetical protein